MIDKKQLERHKMNLETTYITDYENNTQIPLSKLYTLDDDGKLILKEFSKEVDSEKYEEELKRSL